MLGVSAGIAAYKSCEIVRRLREHNCDVTVVPTQGSLQFVGAATWEALSGHPVETAVFSSTESVGHIQLGTQSDLIVVAPATAHTLARAAQGLADDMLTNVLLAATCPVLMVPAMHTQMWQHGATRANVATLRQRGVAVKDPASGRLTGKDSGPGRFPEPEEVIDLVLQILDRPLLVSQAAEQDLAGLRVAISAGGTQEPLDPVRFLGNASSGRMGLALAAAAEVRGAQVDLVTTSTVHSGTPSGVNRREVVTTADLAEAMTEVAPQADVIVMAAAPADFRPAHSAATKIKKDADSGLELTLEQTTDILAGLATGRAAGNSPVGQTIVGFAAETASGEELLALGQQKLRRKGADLLVINDVSGGKVFGADSNAVTIINPDGIVTEAQGSKSIVAHHIWDAILAARS